MAIANLPFKPKQVTKKLLSSLHERARLVIIKRYGLDKNSERMTLEGIGQDYNITRERVRQIENAAIANIRKSSQFREEAASFLALETLIRDLGSLISEEDLLNHLAKDPSTKNHFHFMLTVGLTFKKEREDEEFKHRWHVDPELTKRIHEALRKLYKSLSNDDLVPESEMIQMFFDNLKDINDKYKSDEVSKRWLRISKHIDKNPLGEWGKTSSPNVKTKGIRDFAFLAMRKHGSPIHFRDIAKLIEKLFNKKAHIATTHNELIKDKRFVLVGRGLYALAEWGYLSGVVKDVIKKVLDKHGPLPKDEIIQKVLKERFVKENTILVNLQNNKFFKKDKDGRYHMVDFTATK
ncbi:MAG: sigma factor-like helix-turn-helix DNA-binding protein [bacterium]